MALETDLQRIGRELAEVVSGTGAPPAQGHRRARDGAGFARHGAARGALPARRRDAGVPIARRPRPPPRRVPRRRWTSARRRSQPRCARPTRAPAARRSALRLPPASGTWRTASSSASRRRPRSRRCAACTTTASLTTVDLLGEATVSSAEADRYADRCAEALDTLAEAMASWPGAPEPNLSVKVSALTPALRPQAPELGRDDAAGAAAAAARAGARRRRAPARGHGVARLARDDARARLRAARRGRVPRRPVGRARAAGLPARLARRSSTGSSNGRAARSGARRS